MADNSDLLLVMSAAAWNEVSRTLYDSKFGTEQDIKRYENYVDKYSGCDCHNCKHWIFQANQMLPAFKERLAGIEEAIAVAEKALGR